MLGQGQKQTTQHVADMQQIQNVNTEMKPNMQAMTFEDSVNGKIRIETQAIWGHLSILIWSRYLETDRPVAPELS